MRKPRLAKQTPSRTPKARAPLAGGSVVVVDEVPIRRAALSAYERLEKQINRSREQIEAFESGDLPAYGRWEARLFGAALTELRATLNALEAKKRLLDAIDLELTWMGCTEVEAYRRVTQALDGPVADAPRGPAPESRPEEEAAAPEEFEDLEDGSEGFSFLPLNFDIDRFDRASPLEKLKVHRQFEAMARLYQMFTGKKAPSLDFVLRRERARRRKEASAAHGARESRAADGDWRRPIPAPRAAARPGADRIKELYRTLVRQLHPDANREQTTREKELWHQLQAAYRAGDLEGLEAVAGRVEIGLNRSSANLPIQILLRMTRELRNGMRGLRRQLENARRHPAWAFRKQTAELPKVEAKRRRQIEEEHHLARRNLARCTKVLDDLAARAAGKPKRKWKAPAPARRKFAEEFSF